MKARNVRQQGYLARHAVESKIFIFSRCPWLTNVGIACKYTLNINSNRLFKKENEAMSKLLHPIINDNNNNRDNRLDIMGGTNLLVFDTG